MWRFRLNTTVAVVCLAGCTLLVLTQRTILEPVGGIVNADWKSRSMNVGERNWGKRRELTNC